MKINEGLSVLFWLYKAKKTKDGMVPIYVRITVNGDRDNFSTGKKIAPSDWDEKNSIVKSVGPDYKSVNSYIRKTQSALEKHYECLFALDKRVTAKMVTEAYLPKPDDQKSLMDAFKSHNEEYEELVNQGHRSTLTLKRFKRLKTKTEGFLKKKYKVSDILLENIDYSMAGDFVHYLITVEKIGQNTSMKYVKILKQIIKRAVDKGWVKYNGISGFKCSYTDPDREHLYIEEILKIYNKEITTKRLAEVRDVFIFCCFTGYSYETVYRLETENIFNGVDGLKWISKSRSKTKTKEMVPLLPIALDIIEKYKNHSYCVQYNKLLPVNSNQRYNAYLKEIADICEITKHLTTHTARHTFATTVTLENDVPLETVSNMLGHKDVRTTQIYAKITKRKISNNMKDLKEKLFTKDGLLKTAS